MNDRTKTSLALRDGSRRSFLKKSAVVGAAAATGPWIVGREVLAASRQVNVLAWSITFSRT